MKTRRPVQKSVGRKHHSHPSVQEASRSHQNRRADPALLQLVQLCPTSDCRSLLPLMIQVLWAVGLADDKQKDSAAHPAH